MRTHVRTRVAKIARNAPTSNVPTTQTAAKATVCPNTAQNCWSPSSFW